MLETAGGGIRGAVERARRLPHLRSKYGSRPPVSSTDALEQLPTMDKLDLAACADGVKEKIRSDGVGTYVFASGGTTGAPKLSFIPDGFFLDEIVAVWRPLAGGDVFLNTFAPGKLWSSHYFYNELAVRLGAVTIPVGSLDGDENEAWAQFADDFGVTAIGGTPTALHELFAARERAGLALTGVRALLWVGEPLRERLASLVRRVAPNAELWGLYGSTETWVIGFNTPRCDPATFHPLPYQLLEIEESGHLAVTNVHSRCLNPLVRYRVGDAASWTACDCGRTGAIRIHGRADVAVKFRGALVHAEELADLARGAAGVDDAQIAVISRPGGRERLEIRCLCGPAFDRERVRAFVLGRSLDLSNLFDGDPDGLRVVPVERLHVTNSSRKTPALVHEEEGE